ncbi:hypothetical protein EUX98_g1978 [Antrodiella citrinella]|uniref:Peptidase S53 domain-containing protein n=1 Tax=Antrodiella citrinella TaxID=2447956 RepID=A0A4S4N029_9APHY|nr:hypothetical protein EUX98_g1978 [Antrodiella citrinella]
MGNPLGRRTMQLHESRSEIPDGFVNSGSASPGSVLKLRIALAQNDPAGLTAALLDVSEPTSANFRQHLTKEEVEAFVAPKQETVTAVNQWLSENGLDSTKVSPTGDWISVEVPVSKASELLDASFATFTHVETGDASIRTLAYSIPTDLVGHVELVHPTISGFIEQYANQADLKTFLSDLRKDISSSTTFTLQTLDGGSNPQSSSQASDEANLDIQYTIGLATGVPTTFISVGNDFQDGNLEGFVDIINFFARRVQPPNVLTTSYGQNENTISSSLANQLCNAYQQLGARGTSILRRWRSFWISERPLHYFPAHIPVWLPLISLTSVGATSSVHETSGGFSNVFTQPSYQASAISTYLKALGNTNSGKFTKTGRGFPDVEIVLSGKTTSVSGTSCSSPIFASLISLINDRLIAEGKSPLGFLNPFLYANPQAFNDITTGDNSGCNTNGFPAKAGWDPVTGLGTPNFPALLAAAGAS